jgi:hypothetical protein
MPAVVGLQREERTEAGKEQHFCCVSTVDAALYVQGRILLYPFHLVPSRRCCLARAVVIPCLIFDGVLSTSE